MAFARDSFVATSAQVDFTLGGPYRKEAHVQVWVEGTQLTQGSGAGKYTFFSSTVIRLGTASTTGDIVVLRRRTSHAARITDYKTALLTEIDLDNDSFQAWYMAQEVLDDLSVGVIRDLADEQLDAQTKRIKNVVDPTGIQDAATKKYVDDQTSGAGNVPVPTNPGDDDFVLRATGGTFTWYAFLVDWISDTAAFMKTFLKDDNEGAARTTLGAAGLADANVYTKSQTWKQGADVISAADLLVNIDGNMFDVTGTTTVTTLATKGIGTEVILQFDAAVIMTHHATNLIMPGGVNFTTAAGDILRFYEYAAADWRCSGYALADGLAMVAQADTDLKWSLLSSLTPTGEEAETTALPSTCTRIEILLDGLSGSVADILQVEGGSTTYAGTSKGTVARIDTTETIGTSSGGPIKLMDAGIAALALSGKVELVKTDNDHWIVTASISDDAGSAAFVSSGRIEDAGTWDRLKLSWSGTDVFDLGQVHFWVYS